MTLKTYLALSTAHLSKAAVEFLNRAPRRTLPFVGAIPGVHRLQERPQPDVGGLVYSDLVPDRGGRRHRWLEAGGNSIWSIPHRYGWWVFAHDEFNGEDADEVPADLVTILVAAHAAGQVWVNFDQYADQVAELPVFEESAAKAPSAPWP